MHTFSKGQKIKVLTSDEKIGEVTVMEVVSEKVIIVKDELRPGKPVKFGFVKENESWFVLFQGIYDELNFNQNFPYTLCPS